MPIYVVLCDPPTPEEKARERRENRWVWGIFIGFLVFLGLAGKIADMRRKAEEAKKPKEPDRPAVSRPAAKSTPRPPGVGGQLFPNFSEGSYTPEELHRILNQGGMTAEEHKRYQTEIQKRMQSGPFGRP